MTYKTSPDPVTITEPSNWIQILSGGSIISNNQDANGDCDEITNGFNIVIGYRKISIDNYRENKIITVRYFWTTKINQSLRDNKIMLTNNVRFIDLDQSSSNDSKDFYFNSNFFFISILLLLIK